MVRVALAMPVQQSTTAVGQGHGALMTVHWNAFDESLAFKIAEVVITHIECLRVA
jgi:hypothetical protein